MVKETAASYKLDFKYKFKDGRLKDKNYTLSDFSRRRRYWDARSNFDYAIMAALTIPDGPHCHNNNQERFAEISAKVDATPEAAEAETAFQKWLLRREPVVNAWNDYVEKKNSTVPDYYDKYIPPIGSKPTLMQVAYLISNTTFRKILETSRPFKMKPGSTVILLDKYKNNWRYDPYYWGDHRNAPRIATIVKYVDEVTGKGGTGSRRIEVMFFADGSVHKIAERALEPYDPNNITKES